MGLAEGSRAQLPPPHVRCASCDNAQAHTPRTSHRHLSPSAAATTTSPLSTQFTAHGTREGESWLVASGGPLGSPNPRPTTQADTHGAKRHAATAATATDAAVSVGTDERLVGMRTAMAAAEGGKGLDAYIVPTDDPHQSEYVV